MTLTPADAQVVDALLAGRAQGMAPIAQGDELAPGLELVQPADPKRQAAARELLRLLGSAAPPPMPSADLTQRTMAQIQAQRQRARFAQQVQSLTAPPVAFRWPELIAVAAVLMIGMGVLWPVLAHSRQEARQVACQANLLAAGQAVARFAGDHQNKLPRYANQQANGTWWNVGQAIAPEGPVQSNSANLYLLVRKGYTQANLLNCPENPHAPQRLTAQMHDWRNARERGYSYINQARADAIRVDLASTLPILADQNPQFTVSARNPLQLAYQSEVSEQAASPLHQGRGQNVLTLSGSVYWTPSPVVLTPRGADNIWTAQGVNNAEGRGAPADPTDAHLVP